jgi:hypothetical protein
MSSVAQIIELEAARLQSPGSLKQSCQESSRAIAAAGVDKDDTLTTLEVVILRGSKHGSSVYTLRYWGARIESGQ